MITDIKLEKIIIGTIIASPSAIHEISSFLKPEHFTSPKHQPIWAILLDLEIDKIDRIILQNSLIEQGKLEIVGGEEYLIELVRCSEPADKMTRYAEMLFEMAWKNRLAEFFSSCTKQAQDPTTSVKTIIAESQQGFYDLIQFGVKSEVTKIGDAIDSVIQNVLDLAELPVDERPRGIPSGLIDLDKVLGGGFKGGDLVIVAGRPGMGKSVFAQNVALNAASKFGKKIMFFTMEMSKEQVAERILAMDNKIELTDIRNINFDSEKGKTKLDKLKDKKGKYGKTPLLIVDKSGIKPVEVSAIARHVNNAYGVDMIVIDYAQIMDGTSHDKYQSREQEIAYIARHLKSLAMELQIPVLCLAQVGRQVETRADKRPMSSDLRESGSLENEADIVMFVYRDDVYNEDSDDAGTAELNFTKFRNGDSMARLKFNFAKEFQKFSDMERSTKSPPF